MKNYLNKALIALVLLGAGAQLQAYVYEFSNHTGKTVAISLTYKGIGERRRVRVIKPDTQERFAPGDDDITKGKAGFTPSRLAYILNPSPDLVGTDIKDNNRRAAAMNLADKKSWKAFNITWLPSESYTLAIELADQLGSATEKIAQTGMKAGAAYMSGGATAAAEGASELVKQAASKAKSDALNKAASADIGLGGMIASIGKVAARDFVGDHHFDIVEDEDGKISFISML